MECVIDASVLFCGLIGKGVTKEIIFSEHVTLYSPQALLDEFKEHRSTVKIFSGLSFKDLDGLIGKLNNRMVSVPRSRYEGLLEKANKLISDKDDTEYLALSLALGGIPIWSNDPHFKQQSVVKVFNTKELVGFLKQSGIII